MCGPPGPSRTDNASRRRFLRPVRLPDSATGGVGASTGARTLTIRGKSPVLCRSSSRRLSEEMRLGVTGRSRTGTSGFTAHGSAVELRPHPSALVWSPRQVSNLRPRDPESRALPAAPHGGNLVLAGGNDPSTCALSRRCSATELHEINLMSWLPDVVSNHGPPG
jgi:hypothetical protein